MEEEEILAKVREYVEGCRGAQEGSRGRGRFPNLAGFCLTLGMGVEAFERELASMPRARDMVLATLEDEAINFDPSTSMVTTYLKKRLGYGERPNGEQTACEAGDLKLMFEHDIYEDGGS